MNNTIFDDVFRTILEKMPYLAVPLINEVFGTSYAEDVHIEQLRNEHHLENGEVITDSCLLIGRKLYHIECQSSEDATMAVRMIEYDFSIALERAQQKDGRYQMVFPQSCVLYLRDRINTPDELEVEVVFPDESTHVYHIPTVKVSRYTKDNIFEKRLLMLLPFYIMRYEKQAKKMETDQQALNALLAEYQDIVRRLSDAIPAKQVGLYTDLCGLIIRIADHIFRNFENVKKGFGDVMGGKVLTLRSEELRAEGHAEGRNEGIAEKTIKVVVNMLHQGIDVPIIANIVEISIDEVLRIKQKYSS